MRRRYPGLRVTADDIVVEGDRMAVRSTVSNVGEQGEPMLVEFLRVRDGRIAELWGLTALQRG
jgi:ketosteroid isomerase-like protein